MIQVICCVRDKVADSYGQPFFEVSEDTAKRTFAIACKNSGSLISMSPGDFELHVIGHFDTNIGLIKAVPDSIIARGDDYVENPV